MSHFTPWFAQVCTIQRLSILPDMKSWSRFCDCKIDDRILVGHGFNSVCITIFGELESEVISVEAGLVIVEIHVRELVGGPERCLANGLVVLRVEDL